MIQLYDREMIYHEAVSSNLMSPTHSDWTMPTNTTGINFEIDPWDAQGSENVFLLAFHHMLKLARN